MDKQWIQTLCTIWVTWWVSYKRQELLTLYEYLGSSPVFDGVRVTRVTRLFSCLCCAILCVFCLSLYCVPNVASVSWLSILIAPSVFSIYKTLHEMLSNTNPTKNGDNFRCSRSGNNSCSISGTRRVTLPEHLVFVGVHVVKALFYIFISNIIIFYSWLSLELVIFFRIPNMQKWVS